MIIYIVMTILTYISSNMLVNKYGIMGASINYSLVMFINLLAFYIAYVVISKKQKIVK